MNDDLEQPRRGYDTKDVETMARALDAAEGGRSRKPAAMAILAAAILAALWFIVFR
jgi:hypothetical protein